jgi:Bacterial SH3 domain
MKLKIYLLAALFAAFFYTKTFAQIESADFRCKVSDPTGTLLNIRAKPNGKIVGKLKNGATVFIIEETGDAQDRAWSKIKLTLKGKAKGWVLRELLECD